MNQATNGSTQHVTTVISHQVKPGREQGYEEWLKGIAAVARTFDGYLGVSILRPQTTGSKNYVLVVQFSSCDLLQNWLTSPTRREWIDRVSPLLAEPESIQALTGLEGWFELPVQPDRSSPKRYKQAILAWVGVMLITLLLQPLLNPLLQNLPGLLAIAMRSAITVGLLTYLVMPQITRIFKRWLYP